MSLTLQGLLFTAAIASPSIRADPIPGHRKFMTDDLDLLNNAFNQSALTQWLDDFHYSSHGDNSTASPGEGLTVSHILFHNQPEPGDESELSQPIEPTLSQSRDLLARAPICDAPVCNPANGNANDHRLWTDAQAAWLSSHFCNFFATAIANTGVVSSQNLSMYFKYVF